MLIGFVCRFDILVKIEALVPATRLASLVSLQFSGQANSFPLLLLGERDLDLPQQVMISANVFLPKYF